MKNRLKPEDLLNGKILNIEDLDHIEEEHNTLFGEWMLTIENNGKQYEVFVEQMREKRR